MQQRNHKGLFLWHIGPLGIHIQEIRAYPNFNTPQWYTLPGVTFGTEDIEGQTVAYAEFTLIDGQFGDDTGVDGVIYDQGGPGQPPVWIPTMTGWGMIILSILTAGSALWFIRRRKRAEI